MGTAFHAADPSVFVAVSGVVGFDVARLCAESDEETLRQTQNAQIALYTVGVAAYQALRMAAEDVPIKAAAGHSVGEYAALAAAGVVTIEGGARLVQARGATMAAAGKDRPGAMAAVLGLDKEIVEEHCGRANGVCVLANDNCPGQVVISGDRAAVEQVGALLKEAGAKRVLPLNVSGAFHSPLMEEPAKEMGKALAGAKFAKGAVPVYSNVTAKPGEDWPDLLEKQLKSPVRWTETVQNMAADGIDAFIECGHGSVLCGLIRRTAPDALTMAVNDPESAVAAVDAIKERLG